MRLLSGKHMYIGDVKRWLVDVEEVLRQSERSIKETALENKISTYTQRLSVGQKKQTKRLFSNGKIKPGNHQLPPLPYSYDALEPHIDAEIMQLHHDVHHRNYVKGLNEAERKWKKHVEIIIMI